MKLTDCLAIERPIVSLDVETTGTSPKVDRIVQVGVVKCRPDGTETEWSTFVNPQVPIPAEAMAVHGITDEKVANAPTFRHLARGLADALSACDVVGYDVKRFDIPFIEAECARAGVAFEFKGSIVDGLRLWQFVAPRSLEDACEEYDVTDNGPWHDALVDARRALGVVKRQIDRHADRLSADIKTLHALQWPPPPEDGRLDPRGKLRRLENGNVVFTFGKHAGTRLADAPRDYLEWMLKGDFDEDVKQAVRDAMISRGEESQ